MIAADGAVPLIPDPHPKQLAPSTIGGRSAARRPITGEVELQYVPWGLNSQAPASLEHIAQDGAPSMAVHAFCSADAVTEALRTEALLKAADERSGRKARAATEGGHTAQVRRPRKVRPRPPPLTDATRP